MNGVFVIRIGSLPPPADGVWSYNLAPPFVTAWATKTANDGYTLHWLVTDGTAAEDADYTGITALPGVLYPWVSIGEIEDGEPNFQALSNITWFDSDEQVPPAEVPEPATALLAGLILLGLGVTLRMRG